MKARSLLFVPGDSERKLARADAAGADLLILDLEDSVNSERKAQARALVRTYLSHRTPEQPTQIWVRINALDSSEAVADLSALAGALPDGIVVPKTENPLDLQRLSDELSVLELSSGDAAGRVQLMPILETPRGVLQSAGLLALETKRLGAITWGAEDLSAALGMRARANDQAAALQTARTQCLLVAHALGAAPIETVTTRIKDHEALHSACIAARSDGFAGKLAIHPDQVSVINEAFSPSPEDIAWARRVIAALNSGSGAAVLDGRMIDIVHRRQAQRLLEFAKH